MNPNRHTPLAPLKRGKCQPPGAANTKQILILNLGSKCSKNFRKRPFLPLRRPMDSVPHRWGGTDNRIVFITGKLIVGDGVGFFLREINTPLTPLKRTHP